MRLSNVPAAFFSSVLACVLAQRAIAQSPAGGFREVFALAVDREAALAQLIPGTEDHFYFSCLLRQHEGKLDEVPPLLAAWVERHGRTERVLEIETRQALLGYDRDPKGTTKWLVERLQLSFDQQQQVPGKPSELPTSLDASLFDRDRLLQRALERRPNSLDGLGQGALRDLARKGVPTELLRPFLDRVDDSSMPNLVEMVVREQRMKDASAWGMLQAHTVLTLTQMQEIGWQLPKLYDASRFDNEEFVEACLRRMQPSREVDLAIDAAAREQHLAQIEAFVQPLPTSQSWLKAHVLQHRLQHDLARGVVDEAKLEAYLRLPHANSRTNPKVLEQHPDVRPIQPGQRHATGLPQHGDDSRLVRACFEHVFAKSDSFERWTPFVREDWIRRVFAETKLLSGQGDMARWYALLEDPQAYESLLQRVEISFAPTQPQRFDADADAFVEVDVKNVPMLLVKLYRIDAAAYLREQGKDVDASIDLDGLVANEEQVVKSTEPPVRRVRRTLRFDALKNPGVYVVELVGNGVSSRAVIRKGGLRVVERRSAAGHAFSVFDERGNPVKDAVGYFSGREIAADADGEILVPFRADAGNGALVVRKGAVASLHRFDHAAEMPRLDVAAYLERETLLSGERCKLLVRPSLLLAGASVPLSLLKDAELRIVARTRDGASPTQTTKIAEFPRDGEFVHEFEAPRGLVSLEVSLHGLFRKASDGKEERLAASAPTIAVNGIEQTPLIAAPLVGRSSEGWFFELLGRNGEPVVGRAVSLRMRMRDFVDVVEASAQTDAKGRIALGALPGVASLTASVANGLDGEWAVADAQPTPSRLSGVVSDTLRIPLPEASALSAEVATLVELRNGRPLRDASDALALEDGQLLLRGLAVGDYLLRLPQRGERIDVSISAGTKQGSWLVSPVRALRSEGIARLAIANVAAQDDAVVVRLRNAGPDARVHAFATRYQPAFDPFALSMPRRNPAPPELTFEHSECDYQQGRKIADELRYVLERRYAQKRPGNMLPQPSLLLNPWVLEQAEATHGQGGGSGGRFGGRRGGKGDLVGSVAEPAGGRASNPHAYAALDFLAAQPGLVANLRADAEGAVRIPRASLGRGQMITVVALDGDDAEVRTLALPLQDLAPRDLRLARAFDAGVPMAEQERMEFVAAGKQTRIGDVASTRMRTLATIGDAHALLASLNGSADLAKFAFVTRWPSLSEDERRQLYRDHACHELHLFVYFKDRAWFDSVLRPYLANKAQREFLDDWMLGEDVSSYLEPRRFERLNLVERILLLKRVPGQEAALRRYVDDLAALQPIDVGRQLGMFTAALRSGDLDGGADSAGKRLLDLGARGWDDRVPGASKAKAGFAETREEGPRGPGGGGGGRGVPGADKAPGSPAAQKPQAAAAPSPEPTAGAIKAESKKDAAELRDAEEENQVDLSRKLDEKDLKERVQQRALYREPDATKVFVEHAYWHTPRASEQPSLVPPSAFWRDFAASSAAPFVSPNLHTASGSFTEAMLALAVTDLPFATEPPVTTRDGMALSIESKTPFVLLASEMRPTQQKEGGEPVLIRQACYRLEERFTFDGPQPRQQNVTGEFLAGVGYGCQVVLTNPTEAPRRLSLLLQTPAGALPLHGGPATWSVPVQLDAFATRTVEYAFYFPAAGEFAHYPAHVSEDGAFVGAAEAALRKAVASPTVVDTKSWEHVSQMGDLDAVLSHIATSNLQRLDLSRIAWRLRDREAFRRVVESLRARMCFDATVWSFGLFHGDRAVAREYLDRREDLVASVRGYLRSPLLDVTPVERRSYEHLEFDPLIHARAHRIAAWQKIQNPDLERHWIEFADAMCKRPSLDPASWLEACYYLLLQGRVDEAAAAFSRCDASQLQSRIQHDYLASWFAFSRSDLAAARAVAKPHEDHPVERWRARFRAVLQQADEAEGKAVAGADPRDRDAAQAQLAATEPQLDLAVEGGVIVVRHKNLPRCELRFHRLDVEFAFSVSPFAQQGLTAAGWVEPMRVDAVALDASATETRVPLPADFAQGNVVVEARGAGLVRRAQSLSSSMAVQVVGSYGQVEVRSKEGKPLPAVYVKCYARTDDGKVRFHKDGYTDLRGRFDYASVSEVGGGKPQRFSLLVLSETDGAVLREVDPPVR